MKFYLHGYMDVRVKFAVEAESIDAVAAMADDVFAGKVGVEVERELTGDWDTCIVIDPILEDGSVDYEKSQWRESCTQITSCSNR